MSQNMTESTLAAQTDLSWYAMNWGDPRMQFTLKTFFSPSSN